MATIDTDRAASLIAQHMPQSTRHVFWENQHPATVQAKNLLRSLIRQHAGNDDVESIRAYFNDLREAGANIPAAHVSGAIAYLRSL